MKYRNVGKSGLKVSEIAVGSWMTDLAGTDKVQTALLSGTRSNVKK